MTETMTAERARGLFDYDPETGRLHWKVRISKRVHMRIIYVTKQIPEGYDSADRPASDAPLLDRAGHPFVITDEMLMVGASLVEAWDYGYPTLQASTHEALAKLIYAQMRRLESPQPPAIHQGSRCAGTEGQG